MGPSSASIRWGRSASNRSRAPAWARRQRPERSLATYNRKHGIRYIFATPDVHRNRLYARIRPRRAGSDVLGYMHTIRLCYPARPKLYWIQDILSANWTPDIRAYATANKIELIPPPTHASYLNRIQSSPPPDPRVCVQQNRLTRLKLN